MSLGLGESSSLGTIPSDRRYSSHRRPTAVAKTVGESHVVASQQHHPPVVVVVGYLSHSQSTHRRNSLSLWWYYHTHVSVCLLVSMCVYCALQPWHLQIFLRLHPPASSSSIVDVLCAEKFIFWPFTLRYRLNFFSWRMYYLLSLCLSLFLFG